MDTRQVDNYSISESAPSETIGECSVSESIRAREVEDGSSSESTHSQEIARKIDDCPGSESMHTRDIDDDSSPGSMLDSDDDPSSDSTLDSDDSAKDQRNWRHRSGYSAAVPAESLDYYGPDLFHPVYIGDLYKEGRYRIEQKLGWGCSSTVWRARDIYDNKFVAIKVLAARISQSDNKELRILQRFRDSSLEHLGRKHVLHLLDHFYHKGINGNHLCIVTEPLGETLDDYTFRQKPIRRLCESECRQFSRQLLLALDFMHKCHVVHGDLSSTNIMFPLPEYYSYDKPWIGKVTRHNGKSLECGVPTHLVANATTFIEHEKKREALDSLFVKVVDFSSSFFDDEYPHSVAVAEPLTPPEMVFKRPLSKAIDVWQLACITYWAATRQDIFELLNEDKRALIPQIFEYIGQSTAEWLLGAMIEAIGNGMWKAIPKPCVFSFGKNTLEDIVRRVVYWPDKLPNIKVKEAEEILRKNSASNS
ncbi:kinase-like protein [Aaosphaeria arxii CBS 175.79]|uniref:EKC/KEOPS complex subunit BUD32 n=1 Tax=Aaosphaeria arxii CBS 175.79 TaxID=1450172 RepID=A0A6A5Y872_9PLEO|nr:kinase-like protein [Aaosphaeria arxii CBS 175.79]KAF2021453.1 kinase-like protein [Aaosphaeria arxii CBS 175.79]